ncbi:hypothetical protein [Nocardioides sp.]|uniref:hypothetical protein n=1 Tax=Nocardioides sp. TaxID=35761 RepID=UPI0035156B74
MTPARRPAPSDTTARTPTAAAVLAAAGAARSLLADPGCVELAVDGDDDVLGDLPEDGLGMSDHDGVPLFAVPTDCRLVGAAREHRRAVLTVRAPAGTHGAPGLRLAGWLSPHDRLQCACCAVERATLVLVIDLVILTRDDAAPLTIPVRAFRSPLHALNPGYLAKARRHLEQSHGEELRAAVAHRLGRPEGGIAAVGVAALTPDAVALDVLDTGGSRRLVVRFPRTAHTPADLGDLLRTHLHDHLC